MRGGLRAPSALISSRAPPAAAYRPRPAAVQVSDRLLRAFGQESETAGHASSPLELRRGDIVGDDAIGFRPLPGQQIAASRLMPCSVKVERSVSEDAR